MKATSTRLSSKGQVVIPAEFREAMHLTPGTEMTVQQMGNTLVLRPITPKFIESLIGCTAGAGRERERAHRDDEDR